MSMVSASEIQDDAIGMDNNYQSNMKINQASDSETITESLDDEYPRCLFADPHGCFLYRSQIAR